MILRRTCKQAAALLIARQDRELHLSDKVALRLHLAACDACPGFERQLRLMQSALGQWRHQSAGAEAPPLSPPGPRTPG